MPVSALKIENASLNIGKLPVLRSVSFSVEQGQLVTLLGPSGCGKTTLLKTIAGFQPLDKGRVLINGADVRNVPPEQRDTAMCFQSYALFPHLSAADNIGFGLKQRRIDFHETRKRINALAQQLSLSMHMKKLPGQLSGGQQQRVALARALAVRPAIILFDEPLSNLDAKLRDQVRNEIRALQRAHGFTALYVTHDQAEALAMSDKVVVMNAGMIEQIATPEAIYRQPLNRFVADFIGTANIMPVKISGCDPANNLYKAETPLGEAMIRSQAPPVCDAVYACWRPEDAVIWPTGDSANRFTLTVDIRTFLGSLCEITARSAMGAVSRIQAAGRTRIDAGAQIDIAIAPENIRFLKEPVA